MQSIFPFEETLSKIRNDLFRPGQPLHPLMVAFRSLFDGENGEIPKLREYFEFSFNDFFEWVSESKPTFAAESLIENVLYIYQCLPDSDQISFQTADGSFSIHTICLRRNIGTINITLGIHPLGTSEKFVALTMHGSIENGIFIESDRSLVTEAEPNTNDEYYFYNSGVLTDLINAQIVFTLKTAEWAKISEISREITQKTYTETFELLPLFLALPQYFDFMYDLIIQTKLPIKNVIRSLKASRGRKRARSSKSYILVKSIRLKYLAKPPTIRSQYTIPSRPFRVSGHWRKLKHSKSIGKDHLGNPIAGKTWIRDYTKNLDNLVENSTILDTSPTIIKIKQPLSFGQDVIKAHSLTVHEDSVPSKEWMYIERQKLTAGLRWKILNRDNFHCVLCGATGQSDNALEIDHIVPIVNRGLTEEKNLRTLCKSCNRGKGRS